MQTMTSLYLIPSIGLLDYAISERQEEILKLFLEFGANANALSDVG